MNIYDRKKNRKNAERLRTIHKDLTQFANDCRANSPTIPLAALFDRAASDVYLASQVVDNLTQEGLPLACYLLAISQTLKGRP